MLGQALKEMLGQAPYKRRIEMLAYSDKALTEAIKHGALVEVENDG